MSDSANPDPSASGGDDVRRLLELELQKTRSEASAARLEARAAEIELIMRKLRAEGAGETLGRIDAADAASPIASPIASRRMESSAPATKQVFASWDDVRATQAMRADGTGRGNVSRSSSPSPAPQDFDSPTKPQSPSGTEPSGTEPGRTAPDQPILRVDGKHAAIPRSHRSPDPASRKTKPSESPTVLADPAFQLDLGEPPKAKLSAADVAQADRAVRSISQHLDDEEGDSRPQKRRPAALLVSAVTHIIVLLILATVGLQTQRPKDQVSLSASASESSEVAMESFSIETTEIETEPEEIVEPTVSETEYEISPVGTMKVAEFTPDTIAAPSSSMAASMSSSSAASSASMSLKSDSNSKMEFCGVEGGGNHFVYLVDSSGSMREGFESARQALLASIDLLTPTQRFYVVFFDAEPDYMRIKNPGVDEPNSVYATPENKASLRRWAMRIKKDRGKAPYDPLKFALNLRPDVIFLLSDGEFPEGILELLKEQNHVENLFGETKPISIVHTIGYFSKEGASIMSRIAKQNSGQYRHVPKP